MRLLLRTCLALSLAATASAQQQAPRDNPYDVIGKVFQPFWSVLLINNGSPNPAAILTLEMSDVRGRLPGQMKGATLRAAVEYPDKVRLEAPVLGEQVTVCRNGNDVWATPGTKIQFLLNQFAISKNNKNKKPAPAPANTPLLLPVTAQQAVFLPALFAIMNPDVAEEDTLNGETCRIITASLMPMLAQNLKAEDFKAQIWVAAGYVPKRVIVARKDFSATVEITNLRFLPDLPAATWQPPAGVTDVYHTTPDMLQAVLFVVMNSLKSKSGPDALLNGAAQQQPAQPQQQ